MTVEVHTRLTLEPDPDPLSFDDHSHTLTTVELLVGSEQAKTYGANFRCSPRMAVEVNAKGSRFSGAVSSVTPYDTTCVLRAKPSRVSSLCLSVSVSQSLCLCLSHTLSPSVSVSVSLSVSVCLPVSRARSLWNSGICVNTILLIFLPVLYGKCAFVRVCVELSRSSRLTSRELYNGVVSDRWSDAVYAHPHSRELSYH